MGEPTPSALSFSVHLAAPADEVWAWVTTPEGINDEFRPFLRMTIPESGGRHPWPTSNLR